MTRASITRRRLLGGLALSAAAAALAACGGAASPTTAPTKPDAAPTAAPAAAPKPAEPTKPAGQTAPQAAAPATGGGAKIPLSIAVWEFPDRPWQNTAAQDWQKQHPEVDLKIDKMVYGEYDKKQLALLATGSLQDVFFSGVKWFPATVSKGGMLALDDMIKSKDPGSDDFVPASFGGCKFEGKTYALPFEANPGNYNVVMYSKDLLDAKGIKYPTDDWTYEQFGEMAQKLTDKPKRVWGTDSFYPGNYYDQACIARSLGGEMLSEDGKKFTFNSDPASIKAAQWHYDLINKLEASPKRGDKEGLNFASGRVALGTMGIQSIKGISKAVGDKIKWDVVLGPTGPGGARGSDGFVTMYSIFSKTKYADKAYELLMYETGKEVATRAFVEEGQPPARKSIWASEEAQKINPIWGRAIKWMTDPKTKGPFPHPANLRFSELQDKWVNTAHPLFYGEVGFDEGMKKVQADIQTIVDLPRI
jgi:ABC-type glycerol-3-phosphate transport system substrate-binding protein